MTKYAAVEKSLELAKEELVSLTEFCNNEIQYLTYEQFEKICNDFLKKNEQKYCRNNYISYEYDKNKLNCFREFDSCLIWERWFIDDEYNDASRYNVDTSQYPSNISSLVQFLEENYPNITLIQYNKILENCIQDCFEDENDPYSKYSYKILYIEFYKLYEILHNLKLL